MQLPYTGLTGDEAAALLARDGPNETPAAGRPTVWGQLLRELTHLLALLLWAAVLLALLAGVPTLAAAITVIIVVNALFAFAQEYRADRSTQRLRELLPRSTLVVRDGAAASVPVSELVLGDLVLLAAGDRVPADLRVLETHQLRLDESMVTGESGGVEHRAGEVALAGTFVAQGEATGLVIAVGRQTRLAGIAALAQTARRPPSPLAHQLRRVVRVIAVLAFSTGATLGVAAVLLGLDPHHAFLFGVGVTVALVPEGLLPTVTLSLARGAQQMAGRNALVRRLDAVETLGATTFICTDKTGTLTQNRMAVVEVVTLAGTVTVHGEGYQPTADLAGADAALALVPSIAGAAASCVAGRVVDRDGVWSASGDPMEAALHALALRAGVQESQSPASRRPFTSDRMLSSALARGQVSVLGAPEAVFSRSDGVPPVLDLELRRLTEAGLRVVAVATRGWTGDPRPAMEEHLTLIGLLALEDPPRDDVRPALASCRAAGIRVAMLTGDHPRTARAIAEEVGLLAPGGLVLSGDMLPPDDAELACLLESPGGAVVARVAPEDKFRIARVLRERGHVVAMTGDGVNDAPALREADVGVAMGLSGSDVARESADLILLDDHFGTIVTAVELGRGTFLNVRRFLTYHLTDNVAEVAPFALWALTTGNLPLALGVLQVLALDIGTDMLPAIALGAEPANPSIMHGRPNHAVIDRPLLVRALTVLGPTEALTSMGAFATVLVAGGWTWGDVPPESLLVTASGTAFACISLSQMANAFACRSSTRPVWRLDPLRNRLVLSAVLAELGLLVAFLGVPALREVLGGSWPTGTGWALAAASAGLLLLVDGLAKSSGVGVLPAGAGTRGLDRGPESPPWTRLRHLSRRWNPERR